jgi:N utilization substance protein B
MSKRSRAREIVLKCLYAYETLEGNPAQVFEQTCEQSSQDQETLQFVSNLYFAIIDKLKKIDKEIVGHAEHWDIDRFAMVDKNILRIAICELFFFPDIPARVSINEAIELAKKYSTMDSASFVNGILDAIYKENILVLNEGGKL